MVPVLSIQAVNISIDGVPTEPQGKLPGVETPLKAIKIEDGLSWCQALEYECDSHCAKVQKRGELDLAVGALEELMATNPSISWFKNEA